MAAVLGVLHLGVELHGVELFLRVLHGGHGAVGAVGGHREALRQLPCSRCGSSSRRCPAGPEEQGAVEKVIVLPNSGRRCGRPPAQQVGHGWAAVADAQHRHAQRNTASAQGRPFLVDAVGPAGENDALAVPQGLRVGFVILDLAVDPQVSHPAGDELAYWPPKSSTTTRSWALLPYHLVLFSRFFPGYFSTSGRFPQEKP